MSTPTLELGLVHGQIGVAQQRLGGLPRPDDGDTDAGPDSHGVPTELHRRFAHRVEDPLGQGCHLLRGHAFQQQGELVTAQARSGVPRADTLLQPARCGDDDLVAARMAEAVVHRLEVVQVDEEHRDLAGLASQPGQRMSDPVVEELPVGQSRQWIVEGLMLQPLLEALLSGDVHQDAVPGRFAPLVPQHHRVVAHPHGGFVAVTQPVGGRRDCPRSIGKDGALLVGKYSLVIFGVEPPQPQVGIGHPLLRREAEHPLDLRAHVVPPPGHAGLSDVHDRGNSLDQEPVLLLGGTQIALQPLAVRDVLRHADRVVRVPAGVLDQGDRQVHPDDPAVLADETLLHREMVDLASG